MSGRFEVGWQVGQRRRRARGRRGRHADPGVRGLDQRQRQRITAKTFSAGVHRAGSFGRRATSHATVASEPPRREARPAGRTDVRSTRTTKPGRDRVEPRARPVERQEQEHARRRDDQPGPVPVAVGPPRQEPDRQRRPQRDRQRRTSSPGGTSPRSARPAGRSGTRPAGTGTPPAASSRSSLASAWPDHPGSGRVH